MAEARNIHRRSFIKGVSLTSLSLLPGSRLLAGFFPQGGGAINPDIGRENAIIQAAFRLQDHRNLLSLDFYFVNVTHAAHNFLKGARGKDNSVLKSYMIVRLPQQHIAEQFYVPKTPLGRKIRVEPCGPQSTVDLTTVDEIHALTTISGYSFLAFQIYFDELGPEGLPLTPKALLDWNHPSYRLWVRPGMDTSLFQLKRDVSAPPLNIYPMGYRKVDKSYSYDRCAFPKMKGGNGSTVEPVTALEIPYRLVISPHLPSQDDYLFKWSFSQSPQNGKNELWMARLTVKRKEIQRNVIPESESEEATRKTKRKKKPELSTGGSVPAGPETINEGDNQLQLMIVGSPDFPTPPSGSTITQPAFRMLPGVDDRHDLVAIYLSSRLHATTPGLTFTPLGASTKISFRNSKYAYNKISLYEWKHEISFGRDQEVQVSRVCMEACFGLKMLHIKTTRRETYKTAGALIYREFIMPLEPEKDYTLYDNDANIDAYHTDNWKCATPFKKVEFVGLEPKQILPLELLKDGESCIIEVRPAQDPCIEKDRNILAFWPVTPSGNALEWTFRLTDWHGKTFLRKKRLFILKSDLTPLDPKIDAPFPVSESLDKEVDRLVAKGYGTVTEADKQLLFPVATMESEISKAFSNVQRHEIWIRIQLMGEEGVLKKAEFYRDHLERLMAKIESILESTSGLIRDKVIEEWAVFKRQALQAEGKLLHLLYTIQQRLSEDLERLRTETAVDTSLNTVKGELESLVRMTGDLQLDASTQIARGSGIAQSQLDRYLQVYYSIIGRYSDILEANLSEMKSVYDDIQDRINKLHVLADRRIAITSLGVEAEYKAFIERLPAKYVGLVRGKIDVYVNNFRDCTHHIAHIELTIKSRINCYKDQIGYAVRGVEEELSALKKKLQDSLGEKWEEEYRKLSDYYHEKVNSSISALQTDFLILRNNLRLAVDKNGIRVLDFFHDYASFPQLHTAQVYAGKVNDLVNKEIPLKIRYASEYVRNQVDNFVLETQANVAQVFAALKSDARELVKGAIREISRDLGGIVNPDLAADYLTYYKDSRDEAEEQINEIVRELDRAGAEARATADAISQTLKGQMESLKKEADDAKQLVQDRLLKYKGELQGGYNNLLLISREAKEQLKTARNLAEVGAKEFFKGLEAKILGSIHLSDILGKDFIPPRLDRVGNKISYQFMTNKLEKVKIGPFSFTNETESGPAQLVVYFEKPLDNPKDYKSFSRLSNFGVGIYEERLLVYFDQLEIVSNSSVKNKVSVQIKDVRFQKELAFLEGLSRSIKIPGTGLTLNVTPKEIAVDYQYLVPSISAGAFLLDNLRFKVALSVPLPLGSKSSQEPIRSLFAINDPNDKFVVAVGIWGGRGHFVLEATPKYVTRIDIGIDFGGILQLNLGIAKGVAYLMAGIRYVFRRDELGVPSFRFYAMITCGGNVKVFGFINLSVEFILCLEYESYQGQSTLYGTAAVTYSVSVGFFKKSFTLRFSRRLHGSEGPARQTAFFAPPEKESIYHHAWSEGDPEEDDLFYQAGLGRRQKLASRHPDDLEALYSESEWGEMLNAYKFN